MSSPSESLPPGLAAAASSIRASLDLQMIGSVWAATLVPLLVVLFFFSTPQIRRQPIFIMNTFSVTMGIVVGIVNLKLFDIQVMAIAVPSMLDSPTAFKLLLAYICMILFLPVYMDCILAFRLYVVYPPRRTPKPLLAIIFIPIITFKIVRVTNIVIFAVKFSTILLGKDPISAVPAFQNFWNHAPWTKIEWILQVFDNCYTSAFFLWRVWLGRRVAKYSGVVDSTGLSPSSSGGKLKKLFYLALSSFLFPCILSIIQVIIAFNSKDFFLGVYVFVSNLYFEIIGVLLATIWSGINASEGIQRQDVKEVSAPSFRRGGETGSSEVTPLDDAHIGLEP